MQGLKLDLSAYDGLSLRVLGDGQTFKVNLKTADQDDTPESTYQATFDTVEGSDDVTSCCGQCMYVHVPTYPCPYMHVVSLHVLVCAAACIE